MGIHSWDSKWIFEAIKKMQKNFFKQEASPLISKQVRLFFNFMKIICRALWALLGTGIKDGEFQKNNVKSQSESWKKTIIIIKCIYFKKSALEFCDNKVFKNSIRM